MKRLVVVVDGDVEFRNDLGEYLSHRGYECLGYGDSRTAFNGSCLVRGALRYDTASRLVTWRGWPS